MKNFSLFFLAMIILLLMSNCEKLVDHVYSIKIVNDTDDYVCLYSSYKYPDTLLDSQKPNMFYTIMPNSFIYLDSKDKWEEVLPKDVIIIYILDKDTVDTYSWEKIRDEYKILKRFDLSIEDLENSNWIITYH